MPTRRVCLLLGAAFLFGLGCGFVARPARVVTKVEVREKVVTVTQATKANDVVVVRREIDRPDGTRVVRTVTVDKSVLKETGRTEATLSRDETKTVERGGPQWNVRAMVGLTFRGQPPSYGIGLERRILGPLFFGGYVMSSGIAGATVAFSF